MYGIFAITGGKALKNQTRIADYRLTSTDVERISVWIELLKHMSIATTPDVVMVYLLATHQAGIAEMALSNFDEPYGGTESDNFQFPRPRAQYGLGGLGHITGNKFPPEAFKMAEDYLRARCVMFIELLVDTINYSCGFKRVGLGQRVPKAVANALSGFTCTMSDENIAASAINAFHASIMPDVTSSSWYRGRAHPSLKWNPTISFADRCSYEREEECVDLTAVHLSKLSNISSIISCLGYSVRYSLRNGENDIHLIQPLAKGLEALLYIKCVSTSYGSERAMFLPRINELNTLKSANRANVSRRDFDDNPWLAVLSNVSPAAAICATDLVSVKHQNFGAFDWMYTNNVLAERVYLFISKLKIGTLPEVAGFVSKEYEYECMRHSDHAAKESKKGGCAYERCCCDEAAPCECRG